MEAALSERVASNAECSAKVEKLEADLASNRQTVAQLDDRVARLQTELQRSKDDLTARSEQVRDMEQRIADLKSEADRSIAQERQKSAEQMDDWKSKEASLVAISDQLQSRLDELQRLVASKESQIADANVRLDEAKTLNDKSEEKWKTTQQRLFEKEIELVNLKDDLAGTVSALDQLEAKVKELEPLKEALANETRQRTEEQMSWRECERLVRGENESLSDSVATLRSQLAVAKSSADQLEVKLKELEPLAAALASETQQRAKERLSWRESEQLLQGEKESLSTMVAHLQSQLDECRAEHSIQLQRIKKEADSLMREKRSLSERLAEERDQSARDLQSKCDDVSTLKVQMAEIEGQLAEQVGRFDELERRCQGYQSDKVELDVRNSLLDDECAQLKTQLGHCETEVERLKSAGQEVRRRLEDSQAALHELGRENQSLQMENAKMQGRKWADDSEVFDCLNCNREFTLTLRKHHCRNCGQIFCSECSNKSTLLGNSKKPARVCDSCYKELSSPMR